MRKKKRTKIEKTNNAMPKDEKTKHATQTDENLARKGETMPCEKTSFETFIGVGLITYTIN